MPRFVAFLRAVNVGGRTVAMERLREIFASAGFTEVTTFIASGNVIFTAKRGDPARLEKQIESFLREALGFEVATFVRPMNALPEIVAAAPPHDGGEGDLFIGFLKTPPTAHAQESVIALNSETDEFHFLESELYWRCQTRVSGSRVSGAVLERKLSMPVTVRNVRTVTKIAAAHAPR